MGHPGYLRSRRRALSSKAWDGRERRSSKRVAAVAKIEIRGQSPQFCHTKDLSSGGLFLLCNDPPEIDTILDMQIALPGVKPVLPLQGRVVRRVTQGECGVGIQFINTPTEFHMLLDETIKRLA